MATITIDVPDEIAELLDRQRERLPELLALSLQSPPLPAQLYRDILSFLASQPTAEQIAHFMPSEAMQQRLQLLIERSRAGQLTTSEADELEEFERIEHIMVMIKSANLPALTAQS